MDAIQLCTAIKSVKDLIGTFTNLIVDPAVKRVKLPSPLAITLALDVYSLMILMIPHVALVDKPAV